MGRVLLPLATQTGAGTQLMPWGTQRIGATGSANNVDLFIIDTGVSNDDLNLVEALDFRDDHKDATDNDGHGTHIALSLITI